MSSEKCDFCSEPCGYDWCPVKFNKSESVKCLRFCLKCGVASEIDAKRFGVGMYSWSDKFDCGSCGNTQFYVNFNSGDSSEEH